MTKRKWQPKKQNYNEALKYLNGRRKGFIKSYKTPWPKVNDAGVDGWEFGNIIIIAGRPGSGKTLIAEQIIRQGVEINKDLDTRILQFQFEMLGRASAIREYTSVLNKTYKEICSAGESILEQEELKMLLEYSKTRAELPIDIVEDPCTVVEFKQIVKNYFETYKTEEGYKKTIITIDHSLLFKKHPAEKDKHEMLSNLGEALTDLKKKYPVLFIVLSQLNRNAEDPDRNEDGKYGNYILDSDVYGSDALLQHCDVLIGINRPALKRIKFYGPERYIIEDLNVLVFHFLKVRNGDPRMSFFKARYDIMSVEEMDTPPKQTKLRK
jgi:replicative DNA helicase